MSLLLASGALLSFFATAEVSSTDAQRLTSSGDAKLAAGNASGAADDYRAAIAADAGAFEARVNLGAAMLRLGDAEGAAESLEAARKVKPDSAPVLRNLGRAYLKLERFDEAAEALSKSRAADPGNEEGLRLAGIALQRAGRHADAIPLLRQAATKRPADGELLVELANAEADAGEPDAATKTVERARKAAGSTGADAARIHNNLGIVFRRLGKNEEALAEFRAAAKADPTYAAAIGNLGLALFEAGDAKDAVGTLATAAKRDPDPAIRYALGQARLASGDPKNAIDDLLYARSWGYDPQRIAGLLVKAYEARGDTKSAENERARAGLGSVWTQPVTDAGAAKAFEALNKGRYAEAADLLGALVKQQRDDGKAWLGLGYARFRIGDAAGAVSALETAAKALPKDVDVWYYLGSARSAAGDREGAVAAWHTVLELAPARADVAANVGRLLVELGRAGDALEPLAAAAKALPKNLDVQHDYAVALLETGRPAEAAAVLESYVGARPDDYAAAEARADALGKAGDHKASANAFEWLAKKQPSVSRHALNASVAWRNAAHRKNEKWWIARAAALAPDDAKIVGQLGRMHFEDGEWDAAVDCYARAATLDPADTSAATNAETARKNRDLVAMKASRLHLGVVVVKDKAVAARAAADLKRGKSFAEVAKAVSTHESAPRGGDLGWVDPATLPEWAAAAKKLDRGKTSPVVEIPGGFAIFSRYAD